MTRRRKLKLIHKAMIKGQGHIKPVQTDSIEVFADNDALITAFQRGLTEMHFPQGDVLLFYFDYDYGSGHTHNSTGTIVIPETKTVYRMMRKEGLYDN